MTPIAVDVLIVNFNTAHLLGAMFAHLRQAAEHLVLRCLVVDNASRDDSVARLRSEFAPDHLIVNATNIGFGRANNQLLPLLSGRYVLLLNTDAFVSPNTLDATVAYMEAHPDCGVLGTRLVGSDGAEQPCRRQFPTPWRVFMQRTGLSRLRLRPPDDETVGTAAVAYECDWVPGCYYLVRREVIDSLGLFDPRYFLYCEEVDHCRRVKAAGWKVVAFGGTTVVHTGGESAVSAGALSASGRQIVALQWESELLYFRKHHGLLGVLLHLWLTLVGDAYLLLKAVLTGRGWSTATEYVRHALGTMRLFGRTRWASVPTR